MKSSALSVRGRAQLLKSLHNVRVTLLCGLLTFIVLRSCLGAGKFGTPVQDYDEIRHRLHSFKLRRQQKLLLRRELINAALRKDASRSTLALVTAENAADRHAFVNNGLVQGLTQRSPSHRPHILLVTGSHSCADAIEVELLLKFFKNKMDYCLLHGIEFFHGVEATSAPAKAHVVRELMLSHPNAEWIWWMDSLAMVTDIMSHPPLETYAGYNVVLGIVGAVSRKGMVLDEWENLWMGGSFLLRNCEWSRNYLENAGRMQAGDFFIDTRMKMYEPGMADGNAWPLVTHFGSCSLCRKYSTDRSCFVQMERAFNFADSQKKQASLS